jgi:hypothetical protein
MGLPRSTYYDVPAVQADDAEIAAAVTTICDEFEAYGYRRVGAEQAIEMRYGTRPHGNLLAVRDVGYNASASTCDMTAQG